MRLPFDGVIPMGKPQHQKAHFVTFAKEYTNMECLLELKLKDLEALPSDKNAYRKRCEKINCGGF
jgi:hypothetical protein